MLRLVSSLLNWFRKAEVKIYFIVCQAVRAQTNSYGKRIQHNNFNVNSKFDNLRHNIYKDYDASDSSLIVMPSTISADAVSNDEVDTLDRLSASLSCSPMTTSSSPPPS